VEDVTALDRTDDELSAPGPEAGPGRLGQPVDRGMED
jgi:hypothetical protein